MRRPIGGYVSLEGDRSCTQIMLTHNWYTLVCQLNQNVDQHPEGHLWFRLFEVSPTYPFSPIAFPVPLRSHLLPLFRALLVPIARLVEVVITISLSIDLNFDFVITL